jgi:hypothetical protein
MDASLANRSGETVLAKDRRQGLEWENPECSVRWDCPPKVLGKERHLVEQRETDLGQTSVS